MNEERITISVNEEDVQNIINCYEKDVEELKQLQNNWNELKKWIKEDKEVAETNFEMGRCFNMFDLLNKMQELEGNNE